MRKNPLLAFAVAGAAVLIGAGPAVADDAAPAHSKAAAPAHERAEKTDKVEKSAKPAPAQERSRVAKERSDARKKAASAAAPKERGQVRGVPKGAPDTGVPTASDGGNVGEITGVSAAAAVVLGGAGVLVVRRSRGRVRGSAVRG